MQNPDCQKCKYGEDVRANPTDIKTIRVCKFMPPQLVAVNVPQGVQIIAQFPQVLPGLWCHQFALQAAHEKVNVEPIDLN
jgi:hypothetical protein